MIDRRRFVALGSASVGAILTGTGAILSSTGTAFAAEEKAVPGATVDTTAGKIFAGTYAIFAGVIFLVMVGVILAPVAHRVLHRLHLESGEEG